MKAANVNRVLIDGYLQLLANLSVSNKLDLISRLTLSVKKETANKRKAFDSSFGAFDASLSANDINTNIRESRNFGRQIEPL